MLRRAPLWASFALALLGLSTLAVVAWVVFREADEAATTRPEMASGPQSGPTPQGASGTDKAMAVQVQRYFRRNAAPAPWYSEVELITVGSGVVTVETTLDLAGPQGREAATQICNLIQGSDIADFTPGHTVRGRDGERITCPHRDQRR
jgi:hypothetical protein